MKKLVKKWLQSKTYYEYCNNLGYMYNFGLKL